MLIAIRPRQDGSLTVLLDNGRTVRTTMFHSWKGLLLWLMSKADERQDPAGMDLHNYQIIVQHI